MNLFIGNHFVNTFGNKVDILQLIRLVTDDNETVQAECVEILSREFNLDHLDLVGQGVDDPQALLEDNVLYVNGEAALVIINQLFDHDYDEMMDRIAQQIDTYQSGVLRLTANGFLEAADTPPEGSEVADPDNIPEPPKAPAADLFAQEPDWISAAPNTPTEDPELLGIPSLTVAGHNIPVAKSADGEVLYCAVSLYGAAYGIYHDVEYLQHLIVRNRVVLDVMQSEVVKRNGRYFFSTNVLAILHGDLSTVIEFQSLVQDVVMAYEETIAASPDLTAVKVDQFGNLL